MFKPRRWYDPDVQRERERVELERAGTKLIRSADHQQRRRAYRPDALKPTRSEPLQTRNGWISGLGNLRRAMRVKEQEE